MRSLIPALALALAVLLPNAACGGIRKVARIITGPSLADGFRYPMGLAVDMRHGILAVGDTGNQRLVLFDRLGRYRGALSWLAAPGTASGEPRCVALDGRGRVFVLDAAASRIDVLSTAGSRLGTLEPEIPEAAGAQPQFVAAGTSGALYVLYAGESAGIAVVEPNGRTRALIGFAAAGSGLFETPVALAVDAVETRLAVADPLAPHQVKIVGTNGELLASFGPHGEGDGTYSLAAFVAWGPGDTIWIVDTMRHSVGIHTADGAYLGRIGGFGQGPGQLDYPSAIAFLDDEHLAVLERVGRRLQIFELEPPRSRDPGTELAAPASGQPEPANP
jgi:hypothetical protein